MVQGQGELNTFLVDHKLGISASRGGRYYGV